MSEIDRAELRRLLDEATPGPWVVGGSYTVRTMRSSLDWIARVRDRHHSHADSEDAANAALIVTLHNALPDLIEVVEAIKAERDWINAGKMTRCYLGDKSIDAGELIALGKKVDAALAKLTEEEG